MNYYLVKKLSPWMIDELKVFAEKVQFGLVLLRQPEDFYSDDLEYLKKKGVSISLFPKSNRHLFRKIIFVLRFGLNNLSRFKFNYNGVIGIKSIWWFLRIDTSLFDRDSGIHAQFATQAALIGVLIKDFLDESIKVSFTFHAHDIYFDNKWFPFLAEKAQDAFSISEFNVNYVEKNYGKFSSVKLARLGVFQPPIQLAAKTPGSPLSMGLMSWFMPKKGIFYLLKAMKEIQISDPNEVELILAGDGPQKEEILAYIQENGLENSVNYVGSIKGQDKIEFFKKLDVFVLPSITLENDMDGIPVVLMEAVSYGLPIISTDVSGIPEICIDEFNGYLIPEKNVEKLVESIQKLKNDPESNTVFSNNSLEISKKYDIRVNSLMKLDTMNWV